MKRLKNIIRWSIQNLTPMGLIIWNQFYAGPIWAWNIAVAYIWFIALSMTFGAIMINLGMLMVSVLDEKDSKQEFISKMKDILDNRGKSIPKWLNTLFDYGFVILLAMNAHWVLAGLYLWHNFAQWWALFGVDQIKKKTEEILPK
jgi:hypothetical protein